MGKSKKQKRDDTEDQLQQKGKQKRLYLKLSVMFLGVLAFFMLFSNLMLNMLIFINLYSIDFTYPILKSIFICCGALSVLAIFMFVFYVLFNLPTIKALKSTK